jgi:predicted dehydrogenase
MARGEVGIVQVGLGAWGRDWATRILPQVRGVALLGCADVVPEALAEACRGGVVDERHCFGDLATAIDRLEPDAVLVTTDLRAHAAAVEVALRRGKHVLVEKPFAASLEEAAGLVTLAEELGVTLMVSQNYRFFPAVRAAQWLTAERALGELLHVELDFRRFSAPRPEGPRGHRGWAQPLLLDMSIHHFDLMRAVTGREPTAVDCRTWNPAWAGFDDPPEAAATVELGEVLVSYRGSWVCPDRPTPWAGEWRMEFEHGELWWTSRGGLTDAEDVAWRYDHAATRSAVPLPATTLLDRAGALGELVAAIGEQRDPECSGRDNLASLALSQAAIESARQRRRVELAG